MDSSREEESGTNVYPLHRISNSSNPPVRPSFCSALEPLVVEQQGLRSLGGGSMDTDEGALVSVLIPTSDGKFGNYQ